MGLVAVLHRHLNHQRYTLAAIDDAIARGRWSDWVWQHYAQQHPLARSCSPEAQRNLMMLGSVY
ncbi:MAG: hypothetical protein Q7T22_09995 [Serpentinimonas sp.]|nr:MAG: hypothetical protein JM57_01660 [Comamonadaceae bacterium BICA1-1]MDO8275827.1 hypothetical protein [Serpentinimonas sp.]